MTRRRKRRGLFAWIASLFSLEAYERRYNKAHRSFLDSDDRDWYRPGLMGGGRARYGTYRRARRANRLHRALNRKRRRS